MENINVFLGKVTDVGNGLGVYIPKRNIDYEGLVKGDIVKVHIQKVTKEVQDDKDNN